MAYPVDYRWPGQIRLVGYRVVPDLIQPGQAAWLNLTWQSVSGQPLPSSLFIQLLDGHGEPVSQQEDTFAATMLRWRQGGTVPTQHALWPGDDAAPGPYLVRLGLFDPRTGQRSPVYNSRDQMLGDQVYLGLFYVATDGQAIRQPETPLPAHWNDHLRLLGYSLPPAGEADPQIWPVRLYWQADGPVGQDYTIFLQLLDSRGQRVAGWDAQPLAGHYPTSRWQPGETVVDTFDLVLPDGLPKGSYRLVTGMYDLASGTRLPAFDAAGQLLPDEMVTLKTVKIP